MVENYVIRKSNGEVLPNGTILPMTVNVNACALKLIGQLLPNYGQIIAEDLVHMVENFANIVPPTNSLEGQLAYITQGSTPYLNKSLYLCLGKINNVSQFRRIPIILPTNTTAGATGDMFYDTVNKQYYIYDSTIQNSDGTYGNLVLIGPVSYDYNYQVSEKIISNPLTGYTATMNIPIPTGKSCLITFKIIAQENMTTVGETLNTASWIIKLQVASKQMSSTIITPDLTSVVSIIGEPNYEIIASSFDNLAEHWNITPSIENANLILTCNTTAQVKEVNWRIVAEVLTVEN